MMTGRVPERAKRSRSEVERRSRSFGPCALPGGCTSLTTFRVGAFAAIAIAARSVAVWPDEIERPVDDPWCRYHVADLAGDPFIDAGAAGDCGGKRGRHPICHLSLDLAAVEHERGMAQRHTLREGGA